MKTVLLRILGVIIFIISILLICYPFISNYLMSLNHSAEIVVYDDAIEQYDEKILSEARTQAEEYNKNLLGRVILVDPFDPTIKIEKDLGYENTLNLQGNSIMGSVEVPVLNIKFPIYHGTSEEVLLKGIGHLQNTSLPIGGPSTHSVLTGHTGISSARLFTDINQLVIGDIFYINILGETLAYEVDQIKVILPEETDDLRVVAGEDYVTLVTCTPYGVNSHRLLVRGTRVEYEEAKKLVESTTRKIESTWMKEYKRALFYGSILFVLIIVAFVVARRIYIRKKHLISAKTKSEEQDRE